MKIFGVFRDCIKIRQHVQQGYLQLNPYYININ